MSLARKIGALFASNGLIDPSLGGFPPGAVLSYAPTTPPAGWLLLHGQAVSRTTYSNLFALLGTTYGAGDGVTTFNLPDVRGRVIAGKDNMGGSGAGRLTSGGSGVNGSSLGASGGAETHTLSTAQMPTHSHSYVGGANPAGTGTVGAAGQSANGYLMETITAGSGSAHNNTQPTLVLNYIIKI